MKLKFSFAFLLISIFSFSQISEKDELYKTIMKLDYQIFDEGFNKCDQSSYEKIVSDDLEFYHDVGGITKGKSDFTASIKSNICGNPEKPNRELIKSSLKIYPLYNNKTLYAAVEEGEHNFSILQNGKRITVGTAKFSILWQLENGYWKMKRVLSYDHHPVENKN